MNPFRPAACGLFILLAACQTTGGLSGADNGPYAPGVAKGGEAVDGLTIGHRLMAAGEYELALKAYYLAASEQGATVDVLSAIGSANLRLGRLGQAETRLRQALAVDETFVPAMNNLGVVLMEEGKIQEAREVFRNAFALDSGRSDDIRENLRLAIAKADALTYSAPESSEFRLVRRGDGEYLLLSTPQEPL